ncbi:c-type cytochrome [Alloalcanivorax profundimaris]|uniref:c-type cytochrome n=1 Tax=Alloalcanivorax profundimaris TaxID=2735259 RepID=UPI00210EA099|nr:c-type cytochrome [Alloalcanivorax profundimaris]MCQ6260587.1 c-type cytochrome [Alcanivorax sp. MM125-6]
MRVAGSLALALALTGCGDPEPARDAGAERAEPRPPAAIYGRYCVNCHGRGMAGAPRVGPEYRLHWSHEVEEEGFEHLVKVAIEGQMGMPPRGTCFDCTDEELEATVIYMLKQSGAQ